ncbi:hypothetical protein ACQ4LE_001547 [Meloidogyne hapla]|uniref:Uncharacterized protein n=1 Tax=Meloidogyne hapla TaxID=6305 RepID=A0A1I8B4G7_MELHA
MMRQFIIPFSSHSIYSTQTLLTAVALPSLFFLVAAFPSHKGIYDSVELSSSEMQSGKRMSPFISYQPWSYMKRAPTAPIIRFGKRSNWEELIERENKEKINEENNLQQKRSFNSAPLIRFGRRLNNAPLIRFGRSWKGNEEEKYNE